MRRYDDAAALPPICQPPFSLVYASLYAAILIDCLPPLTFATVSPPPFRRHDDAAMFSFIFCYAVDAAATLLAPLPR